MIETLSVVLGIGDGALGAALIIGLFVLMGYLMRKVQCDQCGYIGASKIVVSGDCIHLCSVCIMDLDQWLDELPRREQ